MSAYTPGEITLGLLRQYGAGHRKPDDRNVPPFVKLGVQSEAKEDGTDSNVQNIPCNVVNCYYVCHSVAEYESHYNSLHRYLCGQCKKHLPNAHLLDLHLSETHDSYFAAQVQSGKQPMFACFLNGCSQRCATPAERKDHCISEHKFPHDFRFDKRNFHSKPKRGKATGEAAPAVPMETDVPTSKASTAGGSKYKKNFSFGHSKARTFDTKQLKAEEKSSSLLESDQMVQDLMESLPAC